MMSKREKRYLIKIISVVLFLMLLAISLLFLPDKTSGAEAVCFKNNFKTLNAHIWSIPNKGKGITKERDLLPGEKSCFIVDNGEKIFVKVEVVSYILDRRFITLKTVGVGAYIIRGYMDSDDIYIKLEKIK